MDLAACQLVAINSSGEKRSFSVDLFVIRGQLYSSCPIAVSFLLAMSYYCHSCTFFFVLPYIFFLNQVLYKILLHNV